MTCGWERFSGFEFNTLSVWEGDLHLRRANSHISKAAQGLAGRSTLDNGRIMELAYQLKEARREISFASEERHRLEWFIEWLGDQLVEHYKAHYTRADAPWDLPHGRLGNSLDYWADKAGAAYQQVFFDE